jgi:hypothetical protein
MKHIGLLTLTILFAFIQLQAQSNKVKNEMVFDKTVDGITAHDFGSIIYGANGKVDFTFTNAGTKPLTITDVKSSCGCTIPTWTKEPVEPGKTGIIKIEYDTKIPGVFNKTVVVYSNANNSPVRIEVRGKVNSQPSDIKPGAGAGTKTNDVSPEMQHANSGSAPAVGAPVPDINGNIASPKTAQRAAYQARMQKEQSPAAPAAKKPATEVKASGPVTPKKK